jgi:amino acid transporter
MKDPQRDVPYTVKRAMAVAVLAYGLPILAILLVLPMSQITSLDGFISAIKTVFTVYGGNVTTAADRTVTATLSGAGSVLGHLAAAGFIWALLSSGTTWIMGADRAEAVACYDGAGPRVLGTFSKRWGTPLGVNLLSGVFATAMFIAAFELTSGNAAKYFTAALGLAISTTTISYLAIFPALYLLRRSHPHVPTPYRIPGGNGVALGISILTFAWALLATLSLLWPGIFTSTDVSMWDASLPTSFAGERLQYELSQMVPLAVFIAVGVLFYALGAPTRRREVDISLLDESILSGALPHQRGPTEKESTPDHPSATADRTPTDTAGPGGP